MKIENFTAIWLITLIWGGVAPAVAMGPDPGGHTGATVTPETTKTGNATVDRAREAASGDKTETNGPVVETSPPTEKRPPDKPPQK